MGQYARPAWLNATGCDVVFALRAGVTARLLHDSPRGMTEICQTRLPEDMAALRALPGVQPIAPLADPSRAALPWICIDEAYGAQMAHRARLMSERPQDVLAQVPGEGASVAASAVAELLDLVLADLTMRRGFAVSQGAVTCPDGRVVPRALPPLEQLGHLVQEDLCIMQKPNGASEHVLTAAVLCFPASWRLSDKIGRPLMAIHDPVAEYDGALGRRVQRLFDGVQAGKPMWRFNRLWYADPELHQPRSAQVARETPEPGQISFLRSERQSIVRLPQSGAVLFAIHTYVLRAEEARSQIENKCR